MGLNMENAPGKNMENIPGLNNDNEAGNVMGTNTNPAPTPSSSTHSEQLNADGKPVLSAEENLPPHEASHIPTSTSAINKKSKLLIQLLSIVINDVPNKLANIAGLFHCHLSLKPTEKNQLSQNL